MKKNLRFTKSLSLLFVMALALFLTACGSSDSSSSKSVNYFGETAPATITADNAKTLASQSAAFGLLPEQPATQTKGLIDTIAPTDSKAGLRIPTMGSIGYGGFEAISGMIRDNDFPNISAADSFTAALTIAVDEAAQTATVSGTLTFANVEHCPVNVDAGEVCPGTYEIDGEATVSITFDVKGYGKYLLRYEETGYVDEEDIPTLAEIAEMDGVAALDTLLRSEALYYSRDGSGLSTDTDYLPYIASIAFDGTFNAEVTDLNFKEKSGTDIDFAMNLVGTVEITDTEAIADFGTPEGETEAGYLEYNTTRTKQAALTATGKLDINQTATDYFDVRGKSNSFADEFLAEVIFTIPSFLNNLNDGCEESVVNGSIDGTVSVSLNATLTETPKDPEGYTESENTQITASVKGTADISVDLIDTYDDQDINITLALRNGDISFANSTEMSKDYTNSTKNASTTKQDMSVALSGNIDVDYTTTFTIISPVTQAIAFKLSGEAGMTGTTTVVVNVDETAADSAEHVDTTKTESEKNYTLKGELTASQKENTFSATVQSATCKIEKEILDDRNSTETDYSYTTINSAVENAFIVTQGMDLGLSGNVVTSYNYKMDEDGTTKVNTPGYVLVNIPSLIINDNINRMAYQYEGYNVGLTPVAADPAADYPLTFAHTDAVISGTYYNSTYGSVAVAGNCQFAFQASKKSKDGFIIDQIDYFFEHIADEQINRLFPPFGAVTITGAGDTTAVLTARNGSTAPDYPVSEGYSITFGDTTTDYEWTDLNYVYETMIRPNWFFVTMTNIVESFMYNYDK